MDRFIDFQFRGPRPGPVNQNLEDGPRPGPAVNFGRMGHKKPDKNPTKEEKSPKHQFASTHAPRQTLDRVRVDTF